MTLLKINDSTFYRTSTREFVRNGETILCLNQRDGFLFNLLIEKGSNHPVSGYVLSTELWSTGKSIDHSGALKQRMYLLRKKLRIIQLDDIIVTICGRGYQIVSKVYRVNDVKGKKKFIIGNVWRVIMKKLK